MAVTINCLCIVLFLVFFNIGQSAGWSPGIVAGTLLALCAVIGTFIISQVKTRLWKFVHIRIDDLDERQVQVRFGSLRRSYAIFTVISLALLLYIAVYGVRPGSMLILIFISLLYLAHSLPAFIIAWTENEV